MKWVDLSLKERKSIYDSVRAQNPDATYFDIKRQFDSIPEYEDGGKKLRKEDLPPEYRIGTPEYFERQRRISGRAEVVQPEAYVTPAGYLKDAITTAEELEQGDYGNAAVSALMNVIPWGIGKVIRGIKSAFNPADVKYSMFDEYPSVGTKTKSKKKTKKESDYDAEFSEVVRRERNIRKYDKEINKTIEDAVFPDRRTMDLLRNVDKRYNTDYEDAYKRMAMRDMTNRGKYVRYQEMPEGKNASISRVKPVGEYGPVIDDYMITIDPLQYLPGTANHELGHLADQLASNPDTNNYLLYLLDESNIMGPGELRAKGINISPNTQAYLLDPSEAKSHMLHLKRALVNEGKIHDWGSTVDQNTIESFLFDPRNSGVVNRMNQNQYNMYRDKSRFVQRMNQLIPMNYLTPMALPFVEYELNEE